jgi:uncharacterized protein YraI
MLNKRIALWCGLLLMLLVAFVFPGVAQAGPPEQGGAVTARMGSNVVMRSGPGREFDDIGSIPYDTVVPVSGRNSVATWLYVTYNGQQGWIAAWLTFLSDSLSTVPVTDASGTPGAAPPPAAPAAPAAPVLPVRTPPSCRIVSTVPTPTVSGCCSASPASNIPRLSTMGAT